MSLRYSSDESFPISVSTQEMFNISDKISRDFSPISLIKPKVNPAKIKLSCKQLLEVSQNISLYYTPKLSSSTKELTLLHINPRQFYTYWNLNENHSHLLLSTMYNNELFLRVYAQPEQGKTHVDSKSIIEFPVHSTQGQQKIYIPSTSSNMLYSATIGKCTSNNDFISLISSNDLHTIKGNNLTSPTKEIKKKDIDYSQVKLINFTSQNLFSSTTNSHYPNTNHSGLGKKTI